MRHFLTGAVIAILLFATASPAHAMSVNGCPIVANAVCVGVNLDGAALQGVDLSGADLTGATLRVADLTGANMRLVRLNSADLTGAYLTGATLAGAFLAGATGDSPRRYSTRQTSRARVWTTRSCRALTFGRPP